MVSTSEIYGIDFSASKAPEDKIWITEAEYTEAGKLSIEESRSARDCLEATGRESVFRELGEFIQDAKGAVLGLDFPFGLPSDAVSEDEWTAMLDVFKTEFEDAEIDAYPGPFEGEDQRKREVDHRYAGQSPFSPLVKYQVFYGLRDLLWPLVDEDAVCVRPMQPREQDRPRLIEVYPAATFGRLGLYRTGYKGRNTGERERRETTIEELQEREDIEISKSAAEAAYESADALDSIGAALATWRAVREGLDREHNGIEGHLYV